MPEEVIGAESLAGSLRKLSQDLGDLTAAHQGVSRIVLAAAQARAPVRTGRLRASGQTAFNAAGVEIGFSVPYAPPIHWGWPARHIQPSLFATKGAEATQGEWIRVYEGEIAKQVSQVKGA